ncbi:hypothetical protein [Sporolactobacillus putidus]|uniref:Uncharacterized protein n=1 Tax=Sporolactobacillus putidus TaxID=492735 RepID=A0A917W3V0_9BACL|nr:hypothetical protein [Sporolactobacillus putidus]GGL64935.1 hypothetical protein GCM10007968_31180 [Sporolactobacillus putidus]
MDQDPFREEHFLRKKMDEYHVEIPDFPMKPRPWERWIDFLASPAKNPFESFLSTASGILLLKIVPIIGAIFLTLIPIFLNFIG